MSDPTIQTFCCHRTGNNEEMSVKVMNEFNSNYYNVVCLASSLVGIIGATYQVSIEYTIITYLILYIKLKLFFFKCSKKMATIYIRINTRMIRDLLFAFNRALFQILPYLVETKEEYRMHSSSRRGRQIVIWLAVADLLASIGTT